MAIAIQQPSTYDMTSIQIRDKLSLINHINHGNPVKYLFFWGHQPRQDGSIDKSCFSQWFEASFQLNGIDYPTAEHYMMAEKARLFNDHEIRDRILLSQHPGEAKKLGRLVKGFNNELWEENRFEIVIQGNIAKFSQNQTLKSYLLGTHKRILVEASPRDQIWGIGLTGDDPRAANPYQWQGLNLLGFALMEVRQKLEHQP